MDDGQMIPVVAPDDEDSSTSDEDDDRIENGFINHDIDGEDDSDSDLEEYEEVAEDQQLMSTSTSTDPRTSSRESHGSEGRNRRQRRVSYDTSLPAQHSYLGTDLVDVQGRTVLDDDYLVTLPLLSLPGLILVPGQVLPLQLQHPALVGMMRKIISGDKVFGLTSSLPSSLSEFGTTAEVRSFSNIPDPGNDDEGLPFLRIKAEGSQRFMVRETWRGVDGILMGKVKILPEVNLIHPFKSNVLASIHGNRFNSKLVPAMGPFPFFVYNLYHEHSLMERISTHLENWATFDTHQKQAGGATGSVGASGSSSGVVTNRTESTVGQTDSIPGSSLVNITRTITTTLRLRREGEEEEEDIDEQPTTSRGREGSDGGKEKSSSGIAPKDPGRFSYWVASNLPLEDSQRLQFLTLDSPIQRLRWLLSILQEYLYLCCVRCKTKIARKEDIFSMSIRGPQGTYVNPNGYVFETLTVYQAESLTLIGSPSPEFSWFPGYAWTICQCASCDNHIGWKFAAMKDKKLQPEFFWGIKRSSIELGLRTQVVGNESKFIAVI